MFQSQFRVPYCQLCVASGENQPNECQLKERNNTLLLDNVTSMRLIILYTLATHKLEHTHHLYLLDCIYCRFFKTILHTLTFTHFYSLLITTLYTHYITLKYLASHSISNTNSSYYTNRKKMESQLFMKFSPPNTDRSTLAKLLLEHMKECETNKKPIYPVPIYDIKKVKDEHTYKYSFLSLSLFCDITMFSMSKNETV